MDTSLIIRILVMAVIGGIIGYVTNVLAVKMLFKPINPIKIPVINYEIIGLIPKRKSDIAKNIGETVGKELIDYDELISSMLREEDKEDIRRILKDRIFKIIDDKASFIPFLFRGKVYEIVEQILDEEFDKGIDELIDVAKEKVLSRIDIASMVETKINELDLIELEEMIIRISKKELKHIENLGLLLGFIIGIVQGVITIFV